MVPIAVPTKYQLMWYLLFFVGLGAFGGTVACGSPFSILTVIGGLLGGVGFGLYSWRKAWI